jgi:hypothetical protein
MGLSLAGRLPLFVLAGLLLHGTFCRAAAVEEALKSVLLVRCTNNDGSQSSGTGFLAAAKNVLVTNFHVIEDAKSIQVEYSDKSVAAIAGYLAISPQHDLAVLRIANPLPDRETLSLKRTPPELASPVFALGSPLGLAQSVSAGIVSQRKTFLEITTELARTGGAPRADYAPDSIWVQTNTPISAGNSGGPLIGQDGEVVGVSTWNLNARNAQNINFAIDVSHVRALLARLAPEPLDLATLPQGPRRDARGSDRGDGAKTLECWNAARNILGQVILERDEVNMTAAAERNRLPPRTEAARRDRSDIRAVAEKLDALPRVGVDPDLVIFLRRLQESFRHLHNSQVAVDNVFFSQPYPGQLQEFWKWVEVRNAHSLNTYTLLHTNAQRLRDVFTVDYGTEFPRFCDSEELDEKKKQLAEGVKAKVAEDKLERTAEKRWDEYKKLKTPEARKRVLIRIIESFPESKAAEKARAEFDREFGND